MSDDDTDITDLETTKAELLLLAANDDECHFRLVRGFLDNDPVALLTMQLEGDETQMVTCLLLNDVLFDRLTVPGARLVADPEEDIQILDLDTPNKEN